MCLALSSLLYLLFTLSASLSPLSFSFSNQPKKDIDGTSWPLHHLPRARGSHHCKVWPPFKVKAKIGQGSHTWVLELPILPGDIAGPPGVYNKSQLEGNLDCPNLSSEELAWCITGKNGKPLPQYFSANQGSFEPNLLYGCELCAERDRIAPC